MFLLLSLVSNKYFDIDSKEHASLISFINYIKFPFTSIEILNEIRIVDSRHIRASQPLFKKSVLVSPPRIRDRMFLS